MNMPLTKLALAIVITSCTYDQTSLVGAAKWIDKNYPGVTDANIICQQPRAPAGVTTCDIDIHNNHIVLECPVYTRISPCTYENPDCRIAVDFPGM
jgi:hypothetical protein